MVRPTPKFLIIDDSISIRKIIIHILKQIGHNSIVEARDGESAYAMLVEHSKKSDPISFIISDLNLPKMSGLDLLKKYKLEKAFQTIPFLLVTADTDHDKINKAYKEGMNDYIIKPFSPAQLKSKFEKFIVLK